MCAAGPTIVASDFPLHFSLLHFSPHWTIGPRVIHQFDDHESISVHMCDTRVQHHATASQLDGLNPPPPATGVWCPKPEE